MRRPWHALDRSAIAKKRGERETERERASLWLWLHRVSRFFFPKNSLKCWEGAVTLPGHGQSAQCSVNPTEHYRVAMSSRYSGHRRACSRDLPSGKDRTPWRLRHLWAGALLWGQDEVFTPVTGTSNSGSLFSEAIGLQHHPWCNRRVSAKSSKFKYKRNKTIPFNHVIILGNTQEPVTCTLVYILLTLCLLLIFYHVLRQCWN